MSEKRTFINSAKLIVATQVKIITTMMLKKATCIDAD